MAGVDTSWLKPTLSQLVHLLELEDNWDSYGALPVDPMAVERALQLLLEAKKEATPPPAIVPSPHGGVKLKWHLRGIDLEAEVRPSGVVSVYVDDRGQETEIEGSLASVLPTVARALAEITRRG